MKKRDRESNCKWCCSCRNFKMYIWKYGEITNDYLFSLFYESHPIWGSLTIVFPLLGFLAALLAVLIGRIQRGDPMPCKKFVLLSIVALTSTFEAFFESGPQLVEFCCIFIYPIFRVQSKSTLLLICKWYNCIVVQWIAIEQYEITTSRSNGSPKKSRWFKYWAWKK